MVSWNAAGLMTTGGGNSLSRTDTEKRSCVFFLSQDVNLYYISLLVFDWVDADGQFIWLLN